MLVLNNVQYLVFQALVPWYLGRVQTEESVRPHPVVEGYQDDVIAHQVFRTVDEPEHFKTALAIILALIPPVKVLKNFPYLMSTSCTEPLCSIDPMVWTV